MRHLDGDDALRRQQMRHGGDEVIELGHLRQHIVGNDQIGVPVVGHHLPRCFGTEEGDERRNACLSRRLRHIGGGLDAKHRHAEGNEMLQQIAVIASELDHEAFRSEPEAALDHLAIAASIRYPGRRIRREIGVFGDNVLRADEFGKLNQPAGVANPDVKRVLDLWRVEFGFGEETLAQRRHAEIDEGGR